MSKPKNRKYSEFRQGVYNPLNRDKCLNKEAVIYRSSLEFRVMQILDKNPNVTSWGSENVIIPYVNPVKSATQNKTVVSRYYMDFYIELKMENDTTKKILVEVKPEKQVNPPKRTKNKKISTVLFENETHAVNLAKWEAAKKFSQNKGYFFYILTEKDISSLEKI